MYNSNDLYFTDQLPICPAISFAFIYVYECNCVLTLKSVDRTENVCYHNRNIVYVNEYVYMLNKSLPQDTRFILDCCRAAVDAAVACCCCYCTLILFRLVDSYQ